MSDAAESKLAKAIALPLWILVIVVTASAVWFVRRDYERSRPPTSSDRLQQLIDEGRALDQQRETLRRLEGR